MRSTDVWCSSSNAGFVPDCHGEEGTESKYKALNLLTDLHPHLWS